VSHPPALLLLRHLEAHMHTRHAAANMHRLRHVRATGASPFFMSERAMDKLQSRKTKPATFNLDMNLIGDYW
jgi:hypothetical protein